MTAGDILVQLLVAAAAFLQGVTGIGFALVAGPVLLMALDDGSALQITALLNLLIALILAPSVARFADRRLLTRFGLAALAAFPLGLLLFAVASPDALKLFAGVVVGGLTLAMIRGVGASGGGARGDWIAGGLAGGLGGALSMLGPPVSLRMAGQNVEKQRNRATVLAFFVFGYPLVFLGQAAVTEFSAEPLWGTLAFAPATLLGSLAGQAAVRHVSERFFRRLVLAVLLATAASLIVDALRSGLIG